MSKMRKISPKRSLVTGLFLIGSLTFLYPIIWMFITSVKTNEEVFANPFGLPQQWAFSNYPEAISSFDFGRFLLNSCIYTGGTIVLTVLLGTMFAYAAARMEFKGKTILMSFLQLGLVVPVSVIILSLFVQLRQMHLRSTYLGLILVYTASALPITITILYGHFRSLPYELEESAYIEGSGPFRTFWKIMLPMVRPAVVTVIIIIFMNYTWNEFTIAFIMTDDVNMRSLPIALTYFMSLRGTEWGMMAATMVLSSIPAIVLYLLGNRQIENAIGASTGLK